MYAPETCRPWSYDCEEAAVDMHVALCCGKEIPLCGPHSAMALDEHVGLRCLVCNTNYTDSTWVILPIQQKTTT